MVSEALVAKAAMEAGAKLFSAIQNSIKLSQMNFDLKQMAQRMDKRFEDLAAEMNRMEENNVVKNFYAASEALRAYLINDSLTDTNIQTLKGLYLLNTGLPLDETTGQMENNDIVAFSYLGLIFLEKLTSNNTSLILWYIIKTYEACPHMAKEYFPEFYQEYYSEPIKKYHELHWTLIEQLALCRKVENMEYLICYYELAFLIDDWTELATSTPEKAIGWTLNKIVGSVYISPECVARIMKMVKNLQIILKGDTLKFFIAGIGTMVGLYCRNEYVKEEFQRKRETEVIRYLSRKYVDGQEAAFWQKLGMEKKSMLNRH